MASPAPRQPGCRPPELSGDDGAVDDAAQEYIDAIAPEHRPLFDRLHRLILEAHPDAEVLISYRMPTYQVGRCRLYVGVWKHGLSVYGWEEGRDAGFAARHPELTNDKGTLKLPFAATAAIPDQELSDFVRAAPQQLSTPSPDVRARSTRPQG